MSWIFQTRSCWRNLTPTTNSLSYSRPVRILTHCWVSPGMLACLLQNSTISLDHSLYQYQATMSIEYEYNTKIRSKSNCSKPKKDQHGIYLTFPPFYLPCLTWTYQNSPACPISHMISIMLSFNTSPKTKWLQFVSALLQDTSMPYTANSTNVPFSYENLSLRRRQDNFFLYINWWESGWGGIWGLLIMRWINLLL